MQKIVRGGLICFQGKHTLVYQKCVKEYFAILNIFCNFAENKNPDCNGKTI